MQRVWREVMCVERVCVLFYGEMYSKCWGARLQMYVSASRPNRWKCTTVYVHILIILNDCNNDLHVHDACVVVGRDATEKKTERTFVATYNKLYITRILAMRLFVTFMKLIARRRTRD
jgi:hypothetical protein